MNNTEKAVILLLKSSLTGEIIEIPVFDDAELANIVDAHNLHIPIKMGAAKCAVTVPDEVRTGAEKRLSFLVNLKSSASRLFAEFEKNGIDYMPLKGTVISGLYPAPYYRYMGDCDVLIREEQYGTISEIMTALGYSEGIETDHEFHWEKNGILFELHKRIVPTYGKDFYSVFGDGWKYANNVKGTTRYEMTPEDFYVYAFTHFAKHYRDRGIGVIQLVDLWLLKDSFDKNTVNEKLSELHLTEFYENIMKLLSVWFEDAEIDEKTDFLTERIFSGGAWGKAENYELARTLRKARTHKNVKKARRVDLLSAIFPPYKKLRYERPYLDGKPLLLPAVWVVRWFDVLFRKRKNISAKLKRNSTINDNNAKDYEKELNYVGLDYWF